MQVVGKWHVTNITDRGVLLTGTWIFPSGQRGLVLVRRADGHDYDEYAIPPHTTVEARTDFYIKPVVCSPDTDFKAAVVLADQYGNRHRVKHVVFRCMQQLEGQHRKAESETLAGIKDPVEKDVAAALKSEVARYRGHGRRVGGLGSLTMVYRGTRMVAVDPGWHVANSPSNQDLAPDPDQAHLESDNHDALLRLYQSLHSLDEKTKFRRALLLRLSKDSEYAPVGYLVVLVLLKVGRLDEALATAQERLLGDAEYGYDDVLRLLDGLLYYRHPDFSTEQLGTIEAFAGNGGGFAESIRTRTAAIRTLRIG